MGRIVVTTFVSLDGVAEAPAGEDFRYKDWAFAFDRGEDGEQFKVDEALGADALLIGRTTYESFAGAWPASTGPLADKYNSMPKYLVSSTITDPEWNNTHVLKGDVVSAVTLLKQEVDGEIQVPGSIGLAHELLDNDLVDEIHLMTYPVVLGAGRRLLGDTRDWTAWKLIESRTVGQGILLTMLERAR